MAQITNLSFDLNDARYSLSIDLDEDALSDETTIPFDVRAVREGEGKGPASLSARVEIRPADRKIVAFAQDREVLDLDGFEDLTSAETLIDELPIEILDPILGCAAKAGISAVVGQGIRCFRSLGESGAWKLFREFLGCMMQKLGGITITTGARTFRCLLKSVVAG